MDLSDALVLTVFAAGAVSIADFMSSRLSARANFTRRVSCEAQKLYDRLPEEGTASLSVSGVSNGSKARAFSITTNEASPNSRISHETYIPELYEALDSNRYYVLQGNSYYYRSKAKAGVVIKGKTKPSGRDPHPSSADFSIHDNTHSYWEDNAY